MASLKHKLLLLRGLLSSERGYIGPYFVHIDVTHRCNLKCLCCRWHSPLIESRRDKSISEDISVQTFKELCQDLKALGTKEMYFVGTGEPFLHSDIFELIDIAKKSGFKLVVYTNGLLLDLQAIQKLIDLKVDVLRVSLWASSADMFVQQVKQMTHDKFHSIINSMSTLSQTKKNQGVQLPVLEFCHTVTRQSYKALDNTVALAKKTGCDKMCFSPLVDFSEESLSHYAVGEKDKGAVCSILRKVKKQLDDLSIPNNVHTMLLHYSWDGKVYERLPCYPAWTFTYVRSDGRIFACQRNTYRTKPLGDLKRKSFREIWNNEDYRSFRRMASTCEGLAKIKGYYCDYCSHSWNSNRIHRYFRHFMPFQKRFKAEP